MVSVCLTREHCRGSMGSDQDNDLIDKSFYRKNHPISALDAQFQPCKRPFKKCGRIHTTIVLNKPIS
jgi:hypothetical protein